MVSLCKKDLVVEATMVVRASTGACTAGAPGLERSKKESRVRQNPGMTGGPRVKSGPGKKEGRFYFRGGEGGNEAHRVDALGEIDRGGRLQGYREGSGR